MKGANVRQLIGMSAVRFLWVHVAFTDGMGWVEETTVDKKKQETEGRVTMWLEEELQFGWRKNSGRGEIKYDKQRP